MVAQPTPRSRATAATAWASCRPADTPRRGPARSAPPETDRGDLLGPGPHPTGLFATAPDPLAPQQHHRPPADGRSRTRTGRRPWSAARIPQPDSRPRWPSCRRRAATRRPPPRRREPQSRQGRAAPTPTHYGVDPPGASFLQTSRIRKPCEVPGAVLAAPTSPSAAPWPTFHGEEPGPGSSMSLTPVTGPRRVRGGRTKTGRHAARQRGRPLTLTEKPRPDPRAATGIVPQ